MCNSLQHPPYESFPPICAANKKIQHNDKNLGLENDKNQTYANRSNVDKTDGNSIHERKVDGKETSALLPETSPNVAADSLIGRGPLTVVLLYAVYSLVAVSTEEIIPGNHFCSDFAILDIVQTF